jgi:hypothetical protein
MCACVRARMRACMCFVSVHASVWVACACVGMPAMPHAMSRYYTPPAGGADYRLIRGTANTSVLSHAGKLFGAAPCGRLALARHGTGPAWHWPGMALARHGTGPAWHWPACRQAVRCCAPPCYALCIPVPVSVQRAPHIGCCAQMGALVGHVPWRAASCRPCLAGRAECGARHWPAMALAQHGTGPAWHWSSMALALPCG